MFKGNSAVNGGGVFVNNSLNLEGNSTFINCSAIVGGAIYANENHVKFSGTNVFIVPTWQNTLVEGCMHPKLLLTFLETTPSLQTGQDLEVEVS